MLAFRTVTYCTENEETPAKSLADGAGLEGELGRIRMCLIDALATEADLQRSGKPSSVGENTLNGLYTLNAVLDHGELRRMIPVIHALKHDGHFSLPELRALGRAAGVLLPKGLTVTAEGEFIVEE